MRLRVHRIVTPRLVLTGLEVSHPLVRAAHHCNALIGHPAGQSIQVWWYANWPRNLQLIRRPQDIP